MRANASGLGVSLIRKDTARDTAEYRNMSTFVTMKYLQKVQSRNLAISERFGYGKHNHDKATVRNVLRVDMNPSHLSRCFSPFNLIIYVIFTHVFFSHQEY